MPACPSSPVPPALQQLGALYAEYGTDLLTCLEHVPDHRSRFGRRYPLNGLLCLCAAAMCGGNTHPAAIADWAATAAEITLERLGLASRSWTGALRRPDATTITRALTGLDTAVLETLVAARAADAALTAGPIECACDHDQPDWPDAATEQAERDCCPGALPQVAVDGKYLRGTGSSAAEQDKLVSAFEPSRGITLAQVPVPEGTNETSCFQPLLAPLDLTGTAVSADAAHTTAANARWLVETKRAHYLLAVKADQPTLLAQMKALDWTAVPDRSRRRRSAHGRWELRSMRTIELDPAVGRLHLPHAATAIRIIRTRTIKGKTTRETVYYVTDLTCPDTTPAAMAFHIRRHWSVENSSHHVRDRTFAEDACTTRTGPAPQALAALRNLIIGLLHCTGERNLASATRRYNRNEPATLRLLGINSKPT